MQSQPQTLDVPRLLSFQGVLLRKDGTLYQDGTFNVTVDLYDAETGGNRVYTSTVPVAVVRGVFAIIIGEHDPLDRIDFSHQLWVSMNAPDALPFEHRTKLTSAPYAMIAHQAVVAGALSNDAPNVVRHLNGRAGNLLIEGGLGVRVIASDSAIHVDASRIRAGPGLQILANNQNELVLAAADSMITPPIVSGRYTNATDHYQYETPAIDIRKARPIRLDGMKKNARILVTLESDDSTTSLTVTDRTESSFKIRFAGGLAPGASVSWLLLNQD